MIAGSDSTATVLRATMLYIITTPYVLQRLRDEIDGAIDEGKISSQITNSEAKALPYLQVRFQINNHFRGPTTDSHRRSSTRVSESTRPSLVS